MLGAEEIRDIAGEVRAAQRGAGQLAPFSSRVAGFDLPTAYAVLRELHAWRVADGDVAVGRKIGFSNPEMWSIYGVRAPVWGYLYASTVRRLPENAGEFSLAGLCEAKIEPEIAFRFRTPPRPGAGPAEMLDCLEWAAHAFEIVQSHFPGWRFEAADTVADGALHAALLLGEPQPPARLAADPVAALAGFSLQLACDGEFRETGRGANVLGSPLRALAHLAELLARQPDHPPLQAGDIVSTGTVTAAWPARPGQCWQTTLAGIALPGLSLTFVA